MYYEKIVQWATHFELEIERLYGILKQFIKITEHAREEKLYPSTISKAHLQKVITEIWYTLKCNTANFRFLQRKLGRNHSRKLEKRHQNCIRKTADISRHFIAR